MISGKTYLLLGAIIFLSICGFSFIHFLDYHETRVDNGGILFDDPLFSVLPIADCSFFIFTITYGSMLLYAATNFKQPQFLSRLMISYGLLLLFRIVTLSLLPLKEPDTLVYLEDPFLNNLIYPGNIDADLFFSGHTGLVFILFFLTRKVIFVALGSSDLAERFNVTRII